MCAHEWAPDTLPGNRQHSRYDYQAPAPLHAPVRLAEPTASLDLDRVLDMWSDIAALYAERKHAKEVSH